MTSKDKLSALFVLPSARSGGAERVMISLLKHLDRNLIRPSLLLLEKAGPLLEIIPEDVPVFSLDCPRVSRALWPMASAIRKLRPHIVLSSIYHLNIAVIMSRFLFPTGTTVIIRESNLPSISLKQGKFAFLFMRLIRWLYPLADSIVCLGHPMQKDLVDSFHIPENRMTVIPNPIDMQALHAKASERENPFDKSKINFVAAGSFTWQKGFEVLFETMTKVASVRPDTHLTILGNGPLWDRLRRMVLEKELAPFVTLPGFTKNPYPYFYHADRFILSSRYEGLPNVALEAVALGTPVIAFDSPGCMRDIITDPSLGTLVSPCTPDALAGAMLASCASKPQKTAFLPEQFKMENIICRYHLLFRESRK